MSTNLSRRRFIQLGATAAAGGLAGSMLPKQANAMSRPPKTVPEGAVEKTVKGFCPFCQVRCTYHAQVRDGKVFSLVGDAGNRWTAGAMCPKGLSVVELIDSPERITEPMVKVNGAWQQISYDEAINIVAGKVKEAIDTYPADDIQNHLGLLMPLWDSREAEISALMTMRLAGCVNIMPAGEVCISTASNVLSFMMGANTSTTTVNEILNTKTLILWGANINDLYPPYSAWLERAKRAGVNIIYIDPRRTRTSIWASQQLMPKPGTDGAMALGMIRYVLEKGNYDRLAAELHTNGLDVVEAACAEFTPERVAEVSGLSVEDFLALCRTYDESASSIIWMGGSLSRFTNGMSTVRSLISLQGIKDNLIGPGKGMLTMEGGKPEGEKEFVDAVCGEAAAAGVNFRRMLALWNRESMDVLFLNSSYRRYPDTNGVREGISKVKYIVHRGFFMTEETEAADIFIPSCFSLETTGSHYGAEKHVVWKDKAVDAPGSCVPDWQFYRDLGRKLFPDTYPKWDTAEDLYKMFLEHVPSWTGMTFERMHESPDGCVWPIYTVGGEERLGTIFDEGHFHTEDGKLALSTSTMGALAWDLPRGNPGLPDADPEYPLIFTQGKVLHHWQLTLTNYAPSLAEFSNGRYISVHPDTAGALGIRQGDSVRLETPTGSLNGWADVTETILPGIVFTPSHFIQSSPFEQTRSEPVNVVVPNTWDRISAQFNGGCCRLVKA